MGGERQFSEGGREAVPVRCVLQIGERLSTGDGSAPCETAAWILVGSHALGRDPRVRL